MWPCSSRVAKICMLTCNLGLWIIGNVYWNADSFQVWEREKGV